MKKQGSMGRMTTWFFALIMFVSIFAIGSPMLGQNAEAAGCVAPSIMFGRWKWCGYFYNKFQDSGDAVRVGGVPGTVDTAQEFIDMIEGDLFSGDPHRFTEAAFVIRTMTGGGLPNPPLPVGTSKPWSWEQLADFESRVRGYANISENGVTSTGSNGSIDWWVNQHTDCGTYNSYWQPAWNDIAPYVDTPANSHCAEPWYTSDFIIFRDRGGNQIYMLRRACLNPMGQLQALSDEPLDNYSLSPTINAQVTSGGVPIAGSTAEPGDSVTFTYAVSNAGPTQATGVDCTIYANTHAGYFVAPTPAEHGAVGAIDGSTGCPRDFPVGNTTIVTEPVNNLPPNSTVCRSLYVAHGTSGGPEVGVESCIIVASKPYARVYGGDVSAGSGFTTAGTCTNNSLGAVVGWNKEAGGNFAGAGSQFATLALNQIYDFATALGNTAGTPGRRLAFANTSASLGMFGGSFGSLPCMPDYYGRMPSDAHDYVSGPLSTLNDVAYKATGPITISGNINPGQRTSLFVQGDVIIDNNITYPGNWASGNTPIFQVVAKGNIYIGSNVTRLDGMYVAQPNGGSKGIIYTCSVGGTPVATDALAGSCATKLTVNGSLTAYSLQLLRANGSLAQSSAAETGASGSAAEVFNYGPLMWIVAPPGQSAGNKYDSITSLPPIL